MLPKNPDRRTIESKATCLVFSILADLELMAKKAAIKIGRLKQAEEEETHLAAFTEAADFFGSYTPNSCNTTTNLCNYVLSLPEKHCAAALNMVAEYWLTKILTTLCDSNFFPHILLPILADEETHVEPLTNIGEPLLRKLEYYLDEISQDPDFLLPFFWAIGASNTLQLGKTIYKAHNDICEGLGYSNGMRDLRKRNTAFYSIITRMPHEVPLTRWQKNKMRLMATANDSKQTLTVRVRQHSTPLKTKIHFVKAISKTLSLNPRMRYVVAGGKLWSPKKTIVGLRETCCDTQDDILTIPLTRPHLLEYGELVRAVAARRRKLTNRLLKNNDVYKGIHEGFHPPSPCSALVTASSAVVGSFGTGPFIEAEGVPLIVTIGGVEGGFVYVTFLYDHRAGDGKLLDELVVSVLKHYGDQR